MNLNRYEHLTPVANYEHTSPVSIIDYNLRQEDEFEKKRIDSYYDKPVRQSFDWKRSKNETNKYKHKRRF